MRVTRTRRIGTSDALKRVVTGLLLVGLSGAVVQQPIEAQIAQARKPKPLPTATIIDLGNLQGYGINNGGQVTGQFSIPNDPDTGTGGGSRAFLYNNGVTINLGTLGGPVSIGHAVNSSGQVTGASFTAGVRFHAFRYSNGVMQDLGTLPGGSESYGFGINDAGQVVGRSSTDVMSPGSDNVYRAFLYSNGVMVDLGTLGGPNSLAIAINNNGQVAGWSEVSSNSPIEHAFVYHNGAMTDVGALIDVNASSSATGINDLGQVVGSYTMANTSTPHAFLYSGGQIKSPGVLSGSTGSYANDINNAGLIVGASEFQQNIPGLPTQTFYRPFLYSNGQTIDLSSLLPANSGWTLETANSVNDKGQITGTGYHNGEYAGYLLTLPKVLPGAGNAGIRGNGKLGNSGRDIQTNFVARSTSKKMLGNVVFNDKINNIALKSTEITSVQVNGNEGVIYGVGKVNGVSGFSFVLTTTDDVSSNKGGDGFSLQISNGYSHTSDFASGGVHVND